MSGPFPIWADIVARSEPPLIALAGGGQTMLALRIFPTRQSVQSWVRAIQQRGWLQEESALGKRDWKSSIPTHSGPHANPNHTVHHLAHLLDPCSSLYLTEVAGCSKRVFRNDAIHLFETGVPRTIRTL